MEEQYNNDEYDVVNDDNENDSSNNNSSINTQNTNSSRRISLQELIALKEDTNNDINGSSSRITLAKM